MTLDQLPALSKKVLLRLNQEATENPRKFAHRIECIQYEDPVIYRVMTSLPKLREVHHIEAELAVKAMKTTGGTLYLLLQEQLKVDNIANRTSYRLPQVSFAVGETVIKELYDLETPDMVVARVARLRGPNPLIHDLLISRARAAHQRYYSEIVGGLSALAGLGVHDALKSELEVAKLKGHL